ncbi:Piwi-domain-containing protein [Cylindrobasidium torrendii FP15055 ss-10]|uniref:Piwi-domain-containing protein n=1 Tax=Cylindrobasidium torrendii FP15055 ss-10 TaxID=1314674 RepID=A0A0D7B9P9_9AGAR|nr:Piwi-domain-containing protein [Cylindrobasidium torrendii FP15055 ss-10]
MASRSTQRGRGGAGQRAGRPAPSFVGRGAPRGRGAGALGSAPSSLSLPSGVNTVGEPRPGYGTNSRKVFTVTVNGIFVPVPQVTLHQYDGNFPQIAVRGKLKDMSSKQRQKLIETLIKTNDSPCPSAVFDGQKILYSREPIDLGNDGRKTFPVTTLGRQGQPLVDRIVLTYASTNDSVSLERYTDRKQSWTEEVASCLAGFNIALRMATSMTVAYSNRKGVVIPRDAPYTFIGEGLEVIRGYYQSLRPAQQQLFLNVDVASAVIPRRGPFIGYAFDVLGRNQNSNPSQVLSPSALTAEQRNRLQDTLRDGISVTVRAANGELHEVNACGVTPQSAQQVSFKNSQGITVNVAQHFAQAQQQLRFPNIICFVDTRGRIHPVERCEITKIQPSIRQISPDAQRRVLEFVTQKAPDRFAAIKAASEVLNYSGSHYVRDVGLDLRKTELAQVDARVLYPPTVEWSQSGKVKTMQPQTGSWNMMDKKLYEPMAIPNWIIVVCASRFSDNNIKDFTSNFVGFGKELGMVIHDSPMVIKVNGHGNVVAEIMAAGRRFRSERGVLPMFIACIIPPPPASNIYEPIKHWGEMKSGPGITTQCLQSTKLVDKLGRPRGTLSQYLFNVLLKYANHRSVYCVLTIDGRVNVKLGGRNSLVRSQSLTDPANPTIVMGADVMHAPPRSETPSYTTLVGTTDSLCSKYRYVEGVQEARTEIIEDLQAMAEKILDKAKESRIGFKRLIFYRDGVSEGERQYVKERELRALKAACAAKNLSLKITFIIVVKRHHIRYFPTDPRERDAIGGCPPGTLVETGITNPIEFDFLLQSHAGILGTSRPAYYHVLCNEIKFSADQIQEISNALCYSYARSTRAVSIPAPVYYADVICGRAKLHYSANADLPSTLSDTIRTRADMLSEHKRQYVPHHENHQARMPYM